MIMINNIINREGGEKMKEIKDYFEAWKKFNNKELKTNELFFTQSYGGLIARVVKQQCPYLLDALGLPIKFKIMEVDN